MCAMAMAETEESAVILVRSQGNAATDLHEAAKAFCNRGWDHDAVIGLERVYERRKKLGITTPAQWLTVFIDGAQTAATAKVFLEQACNIPGVRFCLYCDPPTARSPGSAAARAGAVALCLLGDSSERTIVLLRRLLATDQRWAREVLLSLGTPTALEGLLDHLRSRFDSGLAAVLLRKAVAPEVARVVRKYYEAGAPLGEDDLGVLAALDQDSLRSLLSPVSNLGTDTLTHSAAGVTPAFVERLREIVLRRHGRSYSSRARSAAIWCLAAVDADQAFQPARAALSEGQARQRTAYPYLMVELDQERSVNSLLQQALKERSTSVLWAIGRTLPDAGRALVIEWLQAESRDERLTACRLAARMLPSEKLVAAVRACLDDGDTDVTDAARESWLLLFQSQESQKVLERLMHEKDDSQRWVLLDSLIGLADPGDEHAPGHWVKDVAVALPPLQRQYLMERLFKRCEEVAKEADERNRKI